MPKGGARIRSGPPPDPNALHRERDSKDWTTLPENGREGETPTWPLTKATAPEKALWSELWTMPQAVIWEHQRQHHEVALYVRKFIEASRPKSPANITTAVRQMADSLGLTVPGLLRNKWKIGASVEAPAAATQTATVSARERFRIVDAAG